MITRALISMFLVLLTLLALTVVYGWALLKFLFLDHKAFQRVNYKMWNPIEQLRYAILTPWGRQ